MPAACPASHDVSIPKYFAKLKDPRRAHRRLHLLQDLIVIALCATIAGAKDWQEIALFGRALLCFTHRHQKRGVTRSHFLEAVA